MAGEVGSLSVEEHLLGLGCTSNCNLSCSWRRVNRMKGREMQGEKEQVRDEGERGMGERKWGRGNREARGIGEKEQGEGMKERGKERE